jgi:hypothetical protein
MFTTKSLRLNIASKVQKPKQLTKKRTLGNGRVRSPYKSIRRSEQI